MNVFRTLRFFLFINVIIKAINFIEKYGITRFPSTLLLDQNGNFIEKYSYSEDIDLEEFLKN